MKFALLLGLLLLFIAGCSSNEDFNSILENKENFNKNIDLNGKINFFENGNYYLVDKNSVKIKLENCSDKYNLDLNQRHNLNGYLIKNNDQISFICRNYNSDIENVSIKLKDLNEEITLKTKELDEIKNQKQNEINTLNSQITFLNSQLNSKNLELTELNYKLDNITKEKEITEVSNEILDRGKNFPNNPSIEDFQKWIVLGLDVYKTDPLRVGCCSTVAYRDWYYKVSAVNKNYSITIYADRSSTQGTTTYDSYTLLVENQNDKWTCTKVS